jgi:hypothetical protein
MLLDNFRAAKKREVIPGRFEPRPHDHRHDSLIDYAAMKAFFVRTLCVVLFLATRVAAQDVVPLYPSDAPGSTQEKYPEKEYFSKIWSTEVVANVTKPSLTVFKPAPELRNGTAVVICPGGGFMALSINSEGTDVAKYMAEKGVTAFVLRYRMAHTGEDATQEFVALFGEKEKFQEMLAKVVPLAVADGLALRSPTFGSMRQNGGFHPTASASSASPLVERSLRELPSVTCSKADPPL